MSCKHLNLMYLENDRFMENKVYKDDKDTEGNTIQKLVEYDDIKKYIFNCNECGEIVVKDWLRCVFRADEE